MRQRSPTLGLARTQVPDDPDVRYFVERNPGFADGDRLFILIPLTASSMPHMVCRAALRRCGCIRALLRTAQRRG